MSSALSDRVRYRFAMTAEVLRAPRVELHLSDTPASRRRHAQLTARRLSLRGSSSGGFGAALMPTPSSIDDYLGGRSRALLRRKRRRALSVGLEFTRFNGPDHVDDMVEIHRSAAVRQGRPMLDAYLDRAQVQLYAERAGSLAGVVDGAGIVRAYAHVETHGAVGSFQRLIGHADALEDGIVYLLASETICEFIAARQVTALPHWIMCGNLWANGPGLAYFKRRVGFAPYRARFTW